MACRLPSTKITRPPRKIFHDSWRRLSLPNRKESNLNRQSNPLTNPWSERYSTARHKLAPTLPTLWECSAAPWPARQLT
eukprot:5680609-Pleurochrysis_carterae.AAC.1